MKSNESCPDIETLEQFAQSKLSRPKLESITVHVLGCPQCKQLVDDIRLNQEFMAGPQQDSCDNPLDASTHFHSTGTASTRRRLPDIEGYNLDREIGRGGMGIVYAAIEKELSREVALKLLPAVAEVIQPELITRFRREAKAAARLHHTNIVPIYNFGQSPAGFYYAMELIHGRSLRDVLRELAGTSAQNVSVLALAAAVSQSNLQLEARQIPARLCRSL